MKTITTDIIYIILNAENDLLIQNLSKQKQTFYLDIIYLRCYFKCIFIYNSLLLSLIKII